MKYKLNTYLLLSYISSVKSYKLYSSIHIFGEFVLKVIFYLACETKLFRELPLQIKRKEYKSSNEANRIKRIIYTLITFVLMRLMEDNVALWMIT